MQFSKSLPSTAESDSPRVLPNWTNPGLYKTRICDHFRTKGDCKFGLKCWFAHGRHELRTVPRLDRHPMAALNAMAEVIEALPPSLSRKDSMFSVAETKSQQLYEQLLHRSAETKSHQLYEQLMHRANTPLQALPLALPPPPTSQSHTQPPPHQQSQASHTQNHSSSHRPPQLSSINAPSHLQHAHQPPHFHHSAPVDMSQSIHSAASNMLSANFDPTSIYTQSREFAYYPMNTAYSHTHYDGVDSQYVVIVPSVYK